MLENEFFFFFFEKLENELMPKQRGQLEDDTPSLGLEKQKNDTPSNSTPLYNSSATHKIER
jgi:hypothetical protein